jgi:hypothetical protein
MKKKNLIKTYHYGKLLSKFSLKYWGEHFKRNFKAGQIILVVMFMRNATIEMFTVAENGEKFKYKSGTYVIDTAKIHRDNQTNLSTLFYHQDISIPINFILDIDTNKIKSQIEKLPDTRAKIDKAINPYSLDRFITAEVIQQAIKGQEISDVMRFLKMMMIINTIALGIILFITLQASGILTQVGIGI